MCFTSDYSPNRISLTFEMKESVLQLERVQFIHLRYLLISNKNKWSQWECSQFLSATCFNQSASLELSKLLVCSKWRFNENFPRKMVKFTIKDCIKKLSSSKKQHQTFISVTLVLLTLSNVKYIRVAYKS